MILGIPAQDGHDLTRSLLENLAEVSTATNFRVVILDNASDTPYEQTAYADLSIEVDVIRYEKNKGFYAPLLDLCLMYPDDLIGLSHNDVRLYEKDWNLRMAQCFAEDPKLKLVGLVGSNQVDERGGRGGGTFCNFRGAPGYQLPSTGYKASYLLPSACLDSLFMMFSRDAVSLLDEDWANLPLAHFYDRIWPLRLVEKGYHVGTLGVECDHMGGMTTVANPRYHDDCIKWLEDRGLPYTDPETEMYLVAERRYLGYFRDQTHFIPCQIGADYGYHRV